MFHVVQQAVLFILIYYHVCSNKYVALCCVQELFVWCCYVTLHHMCNVNSICLTNCFILLEGIGISVLYEPVWI
jgi:hypothetical protein